MTGYQSDYVLRLIEQVGSLMRLAFERFRNGADDGEPLELTEQAVGLVVDMDPAIFLQLAPQSMVAFLELSTYDDRVVSQLADILEFQAQLLESGGDLVEASTRRAQAGAVRASLGPLHAN